MLEHIKGDITREQLGSSLVHYSKEILYTSTVKINKPCRIEKIVTVWNVSHWITPVLDFKLGLLQVHVTSRGGADLGCPYGVSKAATYRFCCPQVFDPPVTLRPCCVTTTSSLTSAHVPTHASCCKAWRAQKQVIGRSSGAPAAGFGGELLACKSSKSGPCQDLDLSLNTSCPMVKHWFCDLPPLHRSSSSICWSQPGIHQASSYYPATEDTLWTVQWKQSIYSPDFYISGVRLHVGNKGCKTCFVMPQVTTAICIS